MTLKSIVITTVFIIFITTLSYFNLCLNNTDLKSTYSLDNIDEDYKDLCLKEFNLDLSAKLKNNVFFISFNAEKIYDKKKYDSEFLNKLNIVQKLLVRVISSIDKRPDFYLISSYTKNSISPEFIILGKVSDMVKYLDGYLSRTEYSARKLVLDESPELISEEFFLAQFIKNKVFNIFNSLKVYFKVNKINVTINNNILTIKYDIVEKRKVQRNVVLNKISQIINDTFLEKYPYNKVKSIIFLDVFHERKVTLPFVASSE